MTFYSIFPFSILTRECHIDIAKEFGLIYYITISFIFRVTKCLDPGTKPSALKEIKYLLFTLSLQGIYFCSSSGLTKA